MIRVEHALRRDDAQPLGDNAARAAASSDSSNSNARTSGDAVVARAEAVPSQSIDVEDVLRRYRRRKNPRLRDQLIEELHATVDAMARRLSSRLPPSVDLHDLVHAGVSGLMQAIESYDPQKCDQFAAFAKIRIRGAMLDELRNMDFLPRLYRRRQREREAAVLQLRAELQREPSDAELAQALSVSLADLQRNYAKKGEQHNVSTDGGEDSDPRDAMDQLADDEVEAPFEQASRQELVAKIQESLDPIEWKVLQMHYLEGMTGRDIARRLRLSASRICQIHGRVLDRLKTQMVDRDDLPEQPADGAAN
jgi:RNA polymerase sigma factor FliA